MLFSHPFSRPSTTSMLILPHISKQPPFAIFLLPVCLWLRQFVALTPVDVAAILSNSLRIVSLFGDHYFRCPRGEKTKDTQHPCSPTISSI
jgi:hypothetical protein